MDNQDSRVPTAGPQSLPEVGKATDHKAQENGSSLTIREMELEDLPQVFALGEKLFTAEKWPTLYRTWDEYELVGLFSSDSEYCLVADDGHNVVGFALGTMIEKRRSAWIYGWLLWLGVDPEIKGSGVGKKLLNRVTDLFIENGARLMLVDTEADNEDALRFFRRQGFGNEIEHVYLSRNLTSHPKYKRLRALHKHPKKGNGADHRTKGI